MKALVSWSRGRAIAVCAILLSAMLFADARAGAQAADCKGETTVTVSGRITGVEYKAEDQLYIFAVERTKPCSVEEVYFNLLLSSRPRGCEAGRNFTATGVVDDFAEVTLLADTIRCR